MSDLDLWAATIDEARARLMEGIAEDVDDVVEQLVDEGICFEGNAQDLKAHLEDHR